MNSTFRFISTPSPTRWNLPNLISTLRPFLRGVVLYALALQLTTMGEAAAQLAPVELVDADRRPIVETLRITGSLTSPHTARLSPDVEGRVISLEVDAGNLVKAGDPLFKLDDELAQLDLQQAIAVEHEAEANLADTLRRLGEGKRLVQQRAFPEAEVRGLEAAVQRDRAILERRRAERARASAIVDRHVLKAPFDGIIAERNTDLGERVDSDSDVLALVVVDRLHLDLQVPQSYFRRIGRGTPLTVSVDALPGETIEATIAYVVPVSDPNARTFLVRAQVDNAVGHMTPGMSVAAVLRIGTGREAIVIPRDALIRYPDGRTVVWVADGDGEKRVVSERVVKTGLTFDGNMEIVEGLAQGDSIVVRGNEALQQGQEVRVSE